MKKTGAKSGKWFSTAVILLIILLGGAGLVISLLNRQDSREFSADLEGYEDARFALMGNGFAALSEVSVRLFGSAGETVCSLPRSYPDGMLACSAKTAAVWSEGGTAITVLQSDGRSRDLTFAEGITAADVNDEGYTVVLAGEKGYKGYVDVIRADGTEAYRVYAASSYPLDVDISPDSRHVAILSLTADGSRLSVYATDAEQPEFEWEDTGLYFDLEYLPGGRIFLISAEKAVFLTASGTVAGEYSFGSDDLRDYAFGTSGVVLALEQYRSGTAERIVTLNNDAAEIASLETEDGVSALSAAGNHIAVLGEDDIRLFDWSLNERLSLSSAAGVQSVMMRTDGSAILISGGGAAIIEP